ncbi:MULTISPECIES: SDR family oxidoreductase [unclassified Gordonia (in: high G+C Gram-positive bacteria)]|uniref:SDR family oxidoreductase n=1 Tax=unclassified Gordonia (in: high G+C Gram-positive bacteria) TaxID=2657482 RepID=UPI001F0D7209|nr:SDR family oxidoreductase [Gordonia sp. ABSL49_1]MCH5644787.1 SDR family oxidoreductase [Gordonia sp. ABSL49_1]
MKLRRGGTNLRGKVVLITGAAQGIGRGTAKALAAQGAKLILVDVDAPALDDLGAELGDAALTAIADVTDLSAVEVATAKGIERFGGVDVVVANAGIGGYGSVQCIDPATFRKVIDINITGVFHTVRAALPSVIDRKGYILIVSSSAAYGVVPGLAAYHASKAGVEQFANALRLELLPTGVDVGSAHMSWLDTPLVRESQADMPTFDEMRATLPGPMKHSIDADVCVKAFVRGISRRSRRINVPGWVGLLRWIKPVLTSRVAENATRAASTEILPRMDAEVAALGRSTSARNLESGSVPRS